MDPSLIRRAQAGDQVAFERLAVAMGERMHGVAWRILRDRALAEDATQQALLAMWRHLPSLRDPDRFEAWAYRTLVRACYEEAARHRRWRSTILSWPEQDPPAIDELGPVEDRDLFERVFRQLTVEHRTVLVLHHFLGLTQEECGAVLGISPGTVKSRLSRALSRLRAIVGSETGLARPTTPHRVPSADPVGAPREVSR